MVFVCIQIFFKILLFNKFYFAGDVQWNKNHVFNLCLTIGYFWTTLFVMITLYIFIYGIYLRSLFYFYCFIDLFLFLSGVASNLERKSRENARKMSSLVGTASKKNSERISFSMCVCVTFFLFIV